jgi:hypothetical protein
MVKIRRLYSVPAVSVDELGDDLVDQVLYDKVNCHDVLLCRRKRRLEFESGGAVSCQRVVREPSNSTCAA